MTSDEIREIVLAECPVPKRIWPNGLGFDWRGWQCSYHFNDKEGGYWCVWRGSGDKFKRGYGASYLEAMGRARRGADNDRIDRLLNSKG